MPAKKVFCVMTTVAALILLSQGIPLVQALPASAAQQASPAPASSTEIKTGLGIEKMDLTGASDTFKIAPDTKIYAWARVRGVDAGTNVSLVFSRDGKERHRKEAAVPSIPYRIYSYRIFRSGDAGEWKAIVAGADGKELASASFIVEIAK